MLRFDPQKVERNVERATTEDLLDRVTVYLSGMEPEAVEIIERELARRGVLPEAVEAHAASRRQAGLATDATGLPRICVICREPAVEMRWSWQKLFRLIPIFPRRQAFCALHRRGPASADGHLPASS